MTNKNLKPEEQLVVNSEVEKNKKNPIVAYLLAIFLGTLGIHRFYMGKVGSGVAMLLITVLTLGFGLAITGIWNIVDLFLINGWLKEDQDKLEEKATLEVLANRRNHIE